MASRAELEALWHQVLAAIQATITKAKRPPLEMVSVGRQFLRDNSQGCPSEADRKALEKLHRAYAKRMAEAMQANHIPASMMAECRKWLEYHGVRADIPTAVARQVAQKLADGSLPFTHEEKLTKH
jgi:pyruvoyl-dependent arginine decarboxylase (PvlArgDC)